ncbi:MAG: hypothetical protein ABI488_05000 [Polyangiaceae bacterium]
MRSFLGSFFRPVRAGRRKPTTEAGGAAAGPATGTAGRGGTAGEAGSLADGGAFSANARNPALPAPLDDSCERFHFTEAACVAKQCPPWPCDATTEPPAIPFGWLWCAPPDAKGHCIAGVDCAAAQQAAVTTMDLEACLQLYQPCSVDTDCAKSKPYCVIDAHHASGSCEAGGAGARCRADDDCQSGSLCIAIKTDGTRACADGAEASPCNVDAECKGKRCFHEPGSAVLGMCTSGKPGSPCFSNDGTCLPEAPPCPVLGVGICQGAARCIRVSTNQPTPGGALCSSGNVGDPCSDRSDCKSQHCPPVSASVCTAGNVADPCRDATDCESGFCALFSKAQRERGSQCSTGEAGESCVSPADCKSKHCDAALNNPRAWSVCVDRLGTTGEPCAVAADCDNQVCTKIPDPERSVCTAGQVGHSCTDPLECASGFCVFQCTAGALDDRCTKDADCASQHCVIDSSQNFGVCGA